MFLKFLYRDYKLKFFEIYKYLIKQMVNLKCDVSYKKYFQKARSNILIILSKLVLIYNDIENTSIFITLPIETTNCL